MIAINLLEKEAILKVCPDVYMRRTVSQKTDHHNYYMEERRDAMRVLRRLRGTDVPVQKKRSR